MDAMVELHAIGALVVMVAAGLFTVATGVIALRGGSPLLEWLRRAMLVLIGIQVAIGAVISCMAFCCSACCRSARASPRRRRRARGRGSWREPGCCSWCSAGGSG